jgi:hypothetical protein
LKLENKFTLGDEGVERVSLTMEGFGVLDLGLLNLDWGGRSGPSILIGNRLREEVHHGEHVLLEHGRVDRGVDIRQR